MAREQIGSLHPKLVWIELSPAPVRGLSLLAELRETFPQLYFFVSYEVPDPELIRTAYRLGASDFLDAERLADRLACCRSIYSTQAPVRVRLDCRR